VDTACTIYGVTLMLLPRCGWHGNKTHEMCLWNEKAIEKIAKTPLADTKNESIMGEKRNFPI